MIPAVLAPLIAKRLNNWADHRDTNAKAKAGSGQREVYTALQSANADPLPQQRLTKAECAHAFGDVWHDGGAFAVAYLSRDCHLAASWQFNAPSSQSAQAAHKPKPGMDCEAVSHLCAGCRSDGFTHRGRPVHARHDVRHGRLFQKPLGRGPILLQAIYAAAAHLPRLNWTCQMPTTTIAAASLQLRWIETGR